MPFSSMGDALKQRMQLKGPLKAQVEAAQVVQKAEEALQGIFGEETKHIKVLFVKNRTLTITCRSSLIAQEIRLSQAKIIEKVNTFFPEPLIDRIRYLS
jgi:hypothetical protein